MSYLERRLRGPRPELVERYLREGENLVDRWSGERLAGYQREALSRILVHAWQRNRFYRRKFVAAGVDPTSLVLPEELPRVPLTGREEIRGKPWVLLAVPLHQVSQIHVSTGTTGGEEIYIPHTWEDLHVFNLGPAMRRLVPVGIDDVVVNALPYEMSSAGLAFHRTFQKGCGALVVPTGKGGYYSTPERTLRAAVDLGATILITTPSYAVLLAEAAEREKIALAEIPLRFLWLTGEGCSPAFRERVEALWGHPAYFFYGSLEAGPIGIECPARSGYHVAAGHVYVEIVDPATATPLASGEVGEIVVTELTRLASPVIRYRTGDLGFVDDLPCGCGVALWKLHLRGRAGDQIQVGGAAYSPYYLEELLMRIPEAGNWYELLPKPDRLCVRIEPAAGVPPTETVRRAIESQLEYAIGVAVEVRFVAELPRSGGKTVRVIHEEPCPNLG
ncbi:MAG: phenylacetate--CoA ligase family protein [Candidatus Rokubacteria bacterium]|nr:phenylacetate--CoA ligase family protein [Candidatus Rokubacteria bacterium]